MNLIFQEAIIRKEPLQVVIQYGDLDDLQIMSHTKRRLIVFEDITSNLNDAINNLFTKLEQTYNLVIEQIIISLGNGNFSFVFKEGEKLYNSKTFSFTENDFLNASAFRIAGKILINQVRVAKGLAELDLTDLFKTEIGVMSVQEIKDMGVYGKGLEYWTDTQVAAERQQANEHVDLLVATKPYLYKKVQE